MVEGAAAGDEYDWAAAAEEEEEPADGIGAAAWSADPVQPEDC